MATGVTVDEFCVSTFNELKLGHSHRYVTFRINDTASSIIVDKTGTPADTWQDFVRELPKEEPRYAVFDFEWTGPDGKRSKILFVSWIPESAKIKGKMLYAGSKDGFVKKLVGIGKHLQATDASEIEYKVALEVASSK